MIESIVCSTEPVTLVGGGGFPRQDLDMALRHGPTCVAADSGADAVLEAGVPLEAVIGDFDSVRPDVLARIPAHRQHLVAEQVTTDFEKALARIDAPLVIGVGFAGGRIDHQLAAFHALAAQPDRPCLLVAENELICLAPPAIELPTLTGEVVSLFPLAPTRGRSTGLHWPLEGLDFEVGGLIGTSNRATGPIRVEMDQPGMLMLLPRRLMPEVVARLRHPDAVRWPVP